MLFARRTGTGLVCHASTATPVHSRGECCLRDGLAQDLSVTQARPHRFIHVVNVACETDWPRDLFVTHARPHQFISRGEYCLRDGLAQDLFVTQARPHRFIHVVNVACETDWHRTCLSRKHGHTVHSRGECCLRDGLAPDLFVTQAHGHTGSFTW